MPKKYTPADPWDLWLDDVIEHGACQEAVDWSEPHRGKTYGEVMGIIQLDGLLPVIDQTFDRGWAAWAIVEMGDFLVAGLRLGYLNRIQDPMVRARLFIDGHLTKSEEPDVRQEIREKLPRVDKELREQGR